MGCLKNTDADKYHVLKPVMHRIQKKTLLKIKKTIITNTFCKLVRLTLWRDFSKQTYSFNQLQISTKHDLKSKEMASVHFLPEL